ncbi:MFS transporter [Micromonospora sp. DR5-3]|uniref:MFS transporter n=1 Tax=unclassified Micromonospora TaxID=2617518 RepID=UPI0011D814E5|nr:MULTISPECIES: MFS transporter [unclassified Micromonospora]MCW3814952.1 MFS transporter [Micromonospora sp. DR5-3]TYC25281.1 MFS transporter [Micromonospora sp. MP36]
MSRRLLLLLALACGVAVGNIYFPQTVAPLVASGLRVSPDSATLVVTAVQFGYAAGVFLLVPLGDRFPHRPLITILLGLSGLGLLAATVAPTLPLLVGANALVGIATVVAPIIGPMAAGLVADDQRGVVSGTLLSGSIGGMLLSRTAAGTIGDWWGWRAPYLTAAASVLLIAVVMARVLPATRPSSGHRYPALLGEPLRLLRTEPELRRSCLYQATVFAGFSAVWTGLALLLTSPAYGLGAPAVGMLALVNAATMLCTPVAGRQVDRRGSDVVNLACLVGVGISAAVLAFASLGGARGLAALVLGTLLLDVAMQSGMVANQVRNYTLRPEARSRVNTAYMTCAYLGGSAGSWLGVRAYAHLGWLGVCGLLALLAGVALTRHLAMATATRQGPAVVAVEKPDLRPVRSLGDVRPVD